MPVKFEIIKEYMIAADMSKFQVLSEEENEGRILAGFGAESDDSEYKQIEAGVLISLQDSGNFLQFRMFRLIDRDAVLKSSYRKEFSEYLLRKNYENRLGRWCVDDSDGDVYVDWGLPLHGSSHLSVEQFVRIVKMLAIGVHEAWAPMRRILETGNEKQLNADDLKKELLLALAVAGQYKVIELVSKVADVKKLSVALIAVKANNFDAAASALQ